MQVYPVKGVASCTTKIQEKLLKKLGAERAFPFTFDVSTKRHFHLAISLLASPLQILINVIKVKFTLCLNLQAVDQSGSVAVLIEIL